MLSDSHSSVSAKVEGFFFLDTTYFTFHFETSVKHARINIIPFCHCFFFYETWLGLGLHENK